MIKQIKQTIEIAGDIATPNYHLATHEQKKALAKAENNVLAWCSYLIGEVERLEKYVVRLQDVHEVEKARIRSEVEELQKALEWYADETNYEMVETQVNAYSTETTSATWTDSGERARTALERSETK